jgi:hypothetical protein
MFTRTTLNAFALLASAMPALATGNGAITAPANGSAIAPGASFAFNYISRGDYCKSSYNITVSVLTTNPGTQTSLFLPGTTDGEVAQGHILGTFAYTNYPSTCW